MLYDINVAHFVYPSSPKNFHKSLTVGLSCLRMEHTLYLFSNCLVWFTVDNSSNSYQPRLLGSHWQFGAIFVKFPRILKSQLSVAPSQSSCSFVPFKGGFTSEHVFSLGGSSHLLLPMLREEKRDKIMEVCLLTATWKPECNCETDVMLLQLLILLANGRPPSMHTLPPCSTYHLLPPHGTSPNRAPLFHCRSSPNANDVLSPCIQAEWHDILPR